MDISGSVQNLAEYERQQRKESLDLLTPIEEDPKDKELVYRMIFAAAIATSFHIVYGITLGYSAILLPELIRKPLPINDTYLNSTNFNQTDLNGTFPLSNNGSLGSQDNITNTDDFWITVDQGSWIASIIVLVVPIGAPIGGIFMDRYGRLLTVQIACVPCLIGWILIALAESVPMLIAGRILTGFAAALGTGPALVYISEIARKDIRGSLISFAPAYTSLGMVLAYIKGWAFSWRITAWTCTVYAAVPLFLIMFLIPESPAWLLSKEKPKKAQKSLKWIYKHFEDDKGENPIASRKYNQIRREQLAQKEQEHYQKPGAMSVVKEFFKPTGYKPLLILVGAFFCQQFSGIYITLFHSISFFQEVNSGINPYLASILIGSTRAVMSVVNTYMLKTFKRRDLMLYSCIVMALCMFVSGLFTKWTKEGTTTLNWVPVVAIMLYVVASMVGLLSIPWIMAAELFPLEIRGTAHSVVNSVANLLMFASVQSYVTMKDWLGGVAELQWFFAVVSLGGLVYSYVFLPETHGMELSEIQDYFRHNTVYIGKTKRQRAGELYTITPQK